MGACRAVPQVSYLTEVLRQVVLMVSLSGQLQVATEWVQPHWISPEGANRIKHISNKRKRKNDELQKITQLTKFLPVFTTVMLMLWALKVKY